MKTQKNRPGAVGVSGLGSSLTSELRFVCRQFCCVVWATQQKNLVEGRQCFWIASFEVRGCMQRHPYLGHQASKCPKVFHWVKIGWHDPSVRKFVRILV